MIPSKYLLMFFSLLMSLPTVFDIKKTSFSFVTPLSMYDSTSNFIFHSLMQIQYIRVCSLKFHFHFLIFSQKLVPFYKNFKKQVTKNRKLNKFLKYMLQNRFSKQQTKQLVRSSQVTMIQSASLDMELQQIFFFKNLYIFQMLMNKIQIQTFKSKPTYNKRK